MIRSSGALFHLFPKPFVVERITSNIWFSSQPFAKLLQHVPNMFIQCSTKCSHHFPKVRLGVGIINQDLQKRTPKISIFWHRDLFNPFHFSHFQFSAIDPRSKDLESRKLQRILILFHKFGIFSFRILNIIGQQLSSNPRVSRSRNRKKTLLSPSFQPSFQGPAWQVSPRFVGYPVYNSLTSVAK